MSCPSCLSAKQAEFSAEMIIHLPGPDNLNDPGVWVFPKLVMCLDCGLSRFTVPLPKRTLLTSGVQYAESSARGESLRDIARSSQIAPQSEQ
jgi:hypothetical protein